MTTKASIFTLALMVGTNCFASGSYVGKIDNPYVQQTEQELEYELIFEFDDRARFNDRQRHKFDYGRALSDQWLLEIGFTAANGPGDELDIESYELEAKLQLSEQGEFSNDWGVLFELEREPDNDVWEASSTLIVLHEWQRLVGTANLSLIYENGTLEKGVETALAAQLKYRYRASFEPAIEYFKSEDTNAIGPSILGQKKLAGRNKLYWGAGVAFSLDSSRPDTTFRANIEFEF